MGEVLIAGTASLLMCVFLAPKFIEFLRAREFGQQIREEGPQEHHAKAGTPTMGGLILFLAIAVKVRRTIAQEPAARPSRPSVRLTPFEAPAMTRKMSTG